MIASQIFRSSFQESLSLLAVPRRGLMPICTFPLDLIGPPLRRYPRSLPVSEGIKTPLQYICHLHANSHHVLAQGGATSLLAS